MTTASQQLYASDNIHFFRIAEDREAVFDARTNRTEILPKYVALVLRFCRGFKKLEEHTSEVRAVLPNRGDLAEVGEAIGVLLNRRLLVAWPQFIERIRSDREAIEDKVSRIGKLAIVTCERPDSLSRCLRSYLDNTREFDRSVECVIADDSSSPAGRRGVAAVIGASKEETGVRFNYIGEDEKCGFIDRLVAAGLPADIPRYALLSGDLSSPGANRNAILLETAGETVFCSDDDVVCDPSLAWNTTGELKLEAATDPRVFHFFPDREEARDSLISVKRDVIGECEMWLGRSVHGCVADAAQSDGLDMRECPARMLHDLSTHDGSIAVVMNSLVGDCGLGWLSRLLWLEGESHSNLTRSEAHYSNAKSSREVTRTVRSRTICGTQFFMSGFFGLDNRAIVPPFLPVGRNSDGLFGIVSHALFPDRYTTYLPTALVHAPIRPRRGLPLEFSQYQGQRLSNIIAALLTPLPERTATDALREAGLHLSELAEMPLPDFLDRLRASSQSGLSDLIRRLHSLSVQYNRDPKSWAADLEQYITSVKAALRDPRKILPVEVADVPSLEDAATWTQRMVGQYGRLLCYWPEMVRVTGELREKGMRLGRVI